MKRTGKTPVVAKPLRRGRPVERTLTRAELDLAPREEEERFPLQFRSRIGRKIESAREADRLRRQLARLEHRPWYAPVRAAIEWEERVIAAGVAEQPRPMVGPKGIAAHARIAQAFRWATFDLRDGWHLTPKLERALDRAARSARDEVEIPAYLDGALRAFHRKKTRDFDLGLVHSLISEFAQAGASMTHQDIIPSVAKRLGMTPSKARKLIYGK